VGDQSVTLRAKDEMKKERKIMNEPVTEDKQRVFS